MNDKYVLFGAGKVCREAIDLIGTENIAYIVDNSKDMVGREVEGIKVYLAVEKLLELKEHTIIISVGEKIEKEIEKQLLSWEINNYRKMHAVRYEITKNKIKARPDYIGIYKKAISWILKNTVADEGIICNSGLRESYPEVTGYYIPTLLNWGYKDLAVQYAKWLISIQKEDGSWYDTLNVAPYVFDSAQILKGLIAVRNIVPEVDSAIIKGCEWILSNMQQDGRLVTPDKTAWGTGRTCTELIHLYCLSPLVEAGKLYGREDFEVKSSRILNYYKCNCLDEIKGFMCLSHFYAYIMEALVDLGEVELARECMDNVESIQTDEGMVPAYKDVHWVCSTGLFQLALVWYKLENLEKGNKAFSYACRLQNETGGWYGSYIVDESYNEDNDYFPASEISWANKYFLDALYYKNKLEFNVYADTFLDSIDKNDMRYLTVKNEVQKIGDEICDAGCGKGRYLKKLKEDVPYAVYYGVDLSEKVMEYIDGTILTCKQGSLCSIPFPDESFNLVYTCEALEHAVDIESAIREIARVTKKGGEILIIDKDVKAIGMLEIGEWEQWFDKEELSNVLAKYYENIESDELYELNGAKGLFRSWKGVKK